MFQGIRPAQQQHKQLPGLLHELLASIASATDCSSSDELASKHVT